MTRCLCHTTAQDAISQKHAVLFHTESTYHIQFEQVLVKDSIKALMWYCDELNLQITYAVPNPYIVELFFHIINSFFTQFADRFSKIFYIRL